MFYPSKRSDNTKNSSSSMKLDVRLKNKILHCFKRRHCEKLCCERTSQFYICVYIQCCRRHDISSFLFPAETEVLVPVFSQSTDVLRKKSEGKSKVGTIYFPIHEVPTCLHSTPAGVNRRLGSPLHWKLWWQMCCSEGTSYFLHDPLVVLP